MTKIHSISITNFRGIGEFNFTFPDSDVIALAGRCDSGKTTILDAISWCFYPYYYISDLSDFDFHNSNRESPIKISTTVYDFEEEFITEFKFGLFQRFITPGVEGISEIPDNPDNKKKIALTIELSIDKNLEPSWKVVKGESSSKISYKDRTKFGISYLNSSIDKDFSGKPGSAMNSLFSNGADLGTLEQILTDIRKVKDKILEQELSPNYYEKVQEVIDEVKKIGLNATGVETHLELNYSHKRDIFPSLYDEIKIPFRFRGNGSKRLLSIAMQLKSFKNGAIVLIDELEQGLEPDRIKQLIRGILTLNAQFIFTTHSPSIIEELECNNIVKIIKNGELVEGNKASKKRQNLFRFCPESIFAQKVIVCEGATEIGICRAIDDYREKNGRNSFSHDNIVYVDSKGLGKMAEYSKKLKELGLDVVLFCDSDHDNELNISKDELKDIGVIVIDAEQENDIEKQFFEDINYDLFKKLISEYPFKKEEEMINLIKLKLESGDYDNESKKWTQKFVNAVHKASIAKSKNRFKDISKGQFFGEFICKNLDDIKDTHIGNMIERIIDLKINE